MPARSQTDLSVPHSALDAGRRAEIISNMNQSLAMLIDCYVSSKQAHWNVHGPNFQGLHELFDIIAKESRKYADLVAERILALGGTAHGTVQDISGNKSIKPFPTDEHNWEKLTRAMHERLIATAEPMREAAANMDDELCTQDLYIEVIRGLDMRAWMLEAHLSE